MKKPRQQEVETVVGVAWYDQQRWTRMRLICFDPDTMDDSYDEWRAAAENSMAHLAKAGIRAQRVEIDVDAFLRWCRLHGRKTDKASRAEFTATCLRARSGNSQSNE